VGKAGFIVDKKGGIYMGRFIMMAGLLFICIVPQVWGATSKIPNVNRETMWNKFTDGYHTFGQNAQQKKATLRKLHNARTQARVNSLIRANRAKSKAKMDAWRNSQNSQ
jgi:hypothetical protein